MIHAPELIKQINKGAGPNGISRRTLQWMIDAWRNLKVINGRLIVDGHRVTIECGGGSGSGARKTFSCSVGTEGESQVVRISPGYIIHGTTNRFMDESSVSVPSSAGTYWIYVVLYRTGGFNLWYYEARCTINDQFPEPASNEYIRVLRSVTRSDPTIEEPSGSIRLNPIVNFDGDIYIDGAFST